MQEPSYVKLQVGITDTGITYRVLLPVELQRQLETKLGREFRQGEPWEVWPLENEVGYKICSVKQ